MPKPNRPARAYRGTGYWLVQIGVTALFAVLCLAGGGFVLFAPAEALSRTDPDPERGSGVMMLLIGLGMVMVLTSLVRSFRRMSAEQRAVYAWAVMQQHAVRTDGHPENPAAVGNDLKMLAVAKRAARGELSTSEISALQRLRPDIPYPGTHPDVRRGAE